MQRTSRAEKKRRGLVGILGSERGPGATNRFGETEKHELAHPARRAEARSLRLQSLAVVDDG
jgi:hypothetical protein